MNKSLVRKTVLAGLAAVALSLLSFLGLRVLALDTSVVAAALPDETPTPVPAPILAIDWKEEPALVQDRDDDGVIDPGDTIRYTFVYSNTGTADANLVTIVDDYEQTLIVSVANISGDGTHDHDTVTWEFETIGLDVTRWVTYEATLKDTFPPGSITIEDKASIESAELPRVSVTNDFLVKGPNLTLLKERELVRDLDADGKEDPGDTIKYIILYENTGDIAATQVTIVDDYDEACIGSITGIDPEGNYDADKITWELGTVEPGAGDSVSYEGTLSDLPAGSNTVGNEATISSAEMDPVSTEASFVVEVVPTPTPEPTPTPTPPRPPEGPQGGIFWGQEWLVAALLFLVGGGGIAGLIYAGVHIDIAEGKGNERVKVILEGITVHLIICAVILLALGRGIGAEAAASVLAAVAGYVFGRAKTREKD